MANNVSIQINAQIADAVKNIESFQKSAVKSLERIQKEAQETTKQTEFIGTKGFKFATLLTGASAAIDIVQRLARTFGTAVEAAIAQEEAINNLNSALKRSGQFTNAVSDSLQKYAEQLQATTTYSDDAILGTTAYLATLTKLDQKGLQAATKATVDLAAATGKDLSEAQIIVAKAANGQTESLKKLGIEVKKGATDTETFANALQSLSQFSGAAEAKTGTFSGATAQLTNAFDDFLEEIGALITQSPNVIEAIQAMTSALQYLTAEAKKTDGIFQKSAEAFFTYGGYLLGTGNSAEYLGKQLLKASIDGSKVTEETINQVKQFSRLQSEVKQTAKVIDSDLVDALEKFQSKFKNAGLDRIQILKKEQTEAINQAQEFANKDQRLTKEVESLKARIRLDYATKIAAEQDKIQKEQRDKELKEIARQKDRISSLISGDVQKITTEINVGGKISGFEDLAAIGASFAKNISEGAEGARKTVVSAIGAAFGPVAAQFADFFSQGADAVKKQTEEFVKALPQIPVTIVQGAIAFVTTLAKELPNLIKQLILAVGQIVTTLVESLDEIILGIFEALAEIPIVLIETIPQLVETLVIALVEKLPEVVESLITGIIQRLPEIVQRFIQALVAAVPHLINAGIKSLVSQMPFVAATLAIEMAKQAPFMAIEITRELIRNIPSFVVEAGKALAKAVRDAIAGVTQGVGNVVSGVGSFLGGVGKTVGKIFGFADGGVIKGGQAFKDSVPSVLMPGEMVVDKGLTQQLASFLSSQRNDSSSLLDNKSSPDILSLLEEKIARQPIVVQIGNKEIVSVLRESLESGRVIGL